MCAIQRVHIEPEILAWTIARRGLDVEEYCRKNKLFAAWITGKIDPTFHQAESFARSNYIPFGYLMLERPIDESLPIPFFRTRNGRTEDLNVKDQVKLLSERQTWLSGYLAQNNMPALDYVGSISLNTPLEESVERMHMLLGLEDGWTLACHTVGEAIKRIVDHMEDLGCVVVFGSTVGFSSTRSIEVANCRGLSLVDKYAPFIFVNGKDAQQAQLFTLTHEFTHVLLGFSAGHGDMESVVTNQQERLCDQVAAGFLVPGLLFQNKWRETQGNIERLSLQFKVSRFVIARRALEFGLLTVSDFRRLLTVWEKEPIPEGRKKKSAVPFPIRAVRTNGRLFLVHLDNALNNHSILYRDAYRLTGMKGDTYQKVIQSRYFIGV